jgi:hypothetical protein
LAVAKSTVTGLSAAAFSVTEKVKVVVPVFPSFFDRLRIVTLHSNRRSCRWFLSPQPLPGFVLVGVVVDVVVEVEVVVDVEVVVGVVVVVVEVEVVVDVLVDVEVVVGVVVVVVEVDVEQYWYCEGVVQYW